jgi:hypothetical protein
MSQVQDCRSAQFREPRGLEPEAAPAHPEPLRHQQQSLHRHPFDRHSEAPAQGIEVELVTVKSGDHRKASEPAFGRFGLKHNRQPVTCGETEQ